MIEKGGYADGIDEAFLGKVDPTARNRFLEVLRQWASSEVKGVCPESDA